MAKHKHNLPEPLVPDGDICVPLTIPNDDNYIQLVISVLRQLTQDRMYARDETNSALIVREQFEKRLFTPFINALDEATPCAGTFVDNGEPDCLNYAISSPFINYNPYNPFNGEEIPGGYLTPPFIIYDGLGSQFIGYDAGDLIVPPTSIRPVDYTIFGSPISITIDVVGSGQIELDLLKIPFGGVVVLKVGDNPPNIIDIMLGIINPNIDSIISLDLNSSAIPPEDGVVSATEINIVADVGEKSRLWITFLPVVDAAFIPLAFGGGLRAVQLCGFEGEAADMGITDIRILDGVLQYFIDSQWVVVGGVLEDCTDVEECLIVSPTITQIQTDVLSNYDRSVLALAFGVNNSSRISSNDTDILNLQTLTNDHTAQLAINTNQIGVNFAWTQTNSSRISDNDNEIYDLQVKDVDLQLQLNLLKLDIISLENSILDNRLLIANIYDCTDCDWIADLDFSVSDYSDFVSIVAGAYNGTYYHNIVTYFSQAAVSIASSTDFVLTGITAYYHIVSTGSVSPLVYIGDQATWSETYNTPNVDSDNFTYQAVSPNQTLDSVIVLIQHAVGSGSPTDSVRLYRVKIHGKGLVPDDLIPLLEVN